uniref:F-box/LRR-repeat protein 15/At3g58940/PEG3-like LRR domain-containing protein n=1 Tax=Aegilops tauschii TaxID=37682 RepID=N1QPJ0_AEGTA
MERYCPDERSKVDQWVSCALWHAAPEFELDLRLGRGPICSSPGCSLHPSHDDVAADSFVGDQAVAGKPPKSDPDDSRSLRAHPEDDVPSSDDEETAARSWNPPPSGEYTYTVPRGLFSCAALRSLRLGYCRLSPPAAVSLPALEALHLTHIHEDEEKHVQRLISGCPRLADLTLEACGTVTALSLLDNTHLRRLALRCCHSLSSLAVDTPELRSFEYRGAVPHSSVLTVGGLPSVTSCKVDICTICPLEEAGERVKLGSFLHQLASTAKHLQLCSARMGSWFVDLPVLPALRHLELAGSVSRNDAPAVVVATTSTILRRTPNLELLTLFFEEEAPLEAPRETEWQWRSGLDHHAYVRRRSEGELLDAHRLHYCRHDTLDDALAPATVPPCLGSWVRKIELVHYQGGRAQRTLAKVGWSMS